jgi:hypothetical protein
MSNFRRGQLLMRMLMLLSSLALIAGCSTILGPDVRVQLGTDREVYQRGEEVKLTVANLASDTLIYDGARCAFLERLVDGEWQQIGTIETCFFIAYPAIRIAPGEIQVAAFAADDRFAAGAKHRFFIVIEPAGRRSQRTRWYSNPFEVID